jgi:hypothetical protein
MTLSDIHDRWKCTGGRNTFSGIGRAAAYEYMVDTQLPMYIVHMNGWKKILVHFLG